VLDKTSRFMAVFALSLSAGALAGCTTTPTPYQPYVSEGARGVHGGFSEVRLAPDRFAVRFHGNEMTSRERVEGYLLYRAAELTVQNGYDWFQMADRHTEHDVQTTVRPDPSYRPWYGYPHWRPYWSYYGNGGWNYWNPWDGGPFWYDRMDVRRVEAFETTAEIVMRKGPLPADDPRAMDARKVMANLGPTIQRPGG
jgi:hypothetical protein